ncbi:MAG: hybrid sensor histidine kinase/response regulator [Myxococcota bacterium]
MSSEAESLYGVESRDRAGWVEQAFEEAPDGFVLLDKDGYVIRANELACALLELPESEFVGSRYLEFIADGYDTLARKFFQEACDGKPVRAELPLVGAKMAQRRTEFTARRIDGDEEFALMLVLRDISPESESVEQLQRATEKLAQIEGMQLVAQLAGGLVHDLNNMLAVINSYGQLLKHELADRPELVRDVEEIIQAGETAASLSRRLLSVGRQRSVDDQESEDLDVNAEVDRLVSFLERVMPPRVVLETRLDDSRPIVSLTHVELEQVLLNLILNARDAVDGNGRVRVETHAPDPAGEEFERAFVEIRVVDNGQGIPEDKIAKIFEPFFTTKEAGEGTGMGLSMVQRIVEDAGGSVDVESSVGHGTTMILRLPTSTSSGSDVGIEESTLVVEETGSERVLVVDGNASSRRLIQRVLAENGYDVLVAKNQSEARTILNRDVEPPELVILDARPEHSDAMDFTSDLQSEFNSLKFVFTVEEGEEEYTDGNDHLLTRPITPGSLASLVRYALDAD